VHAHLIEIEVTVVKFGIDCGWRLVLLMQLQHFIIGTIGKGLHLLMQPLFLNVSRYFYLTLSITRWVK